MNIICGSSLLRALLMGATALALVGPAMAQSKVGVTSATDGDPLGKPPAESERVLRIGIDVQANELVTTNGNDRAHLVFLDGSSLTVGPNARLTIDKFVYDPNTKTGELAVTASQGVLRLVGGKISKTNAITINTPSGTIGIRGGIGVFGINSDKTTAAFLYGQIMSLTGRQGQTQNATRAGSVMSVNFGAAAGLPSLLPPGGLNALVNSLQLASNNSGKGGSSGNADQKAQSSGFTGNNSGQGASGGNPGGGPPNTNNNSVTTAIQNSGGASNPQDNTTPGQPAPMPAVQLPNTQSASFSGGMLGVAQNSNGPIRVVTGSFGLNYNWGQGAGAWNANFDNRSYVGSVNGTGGANFGGSGIPATTANNTMAVNGSFLTGPAAGRAVVAVVGQFSATGNGYQASGVFGGAKH
jgi:hypothetical protein